MRHIKTTVTVLAAVAVLVLAGNTVALAATGKGFLLGKSNKASAMTSLSRTGAGPALKVLTKASASAPFVVNGKGKVANLNADSIDGYDSAALRNRTYVWTHAINTPVTGFSVQLPLTPGSYEIGYSAYLSGGDANGSAGCTLVKQLPDGSHIWYGEVRSPTVTGSTPSYSGTAVVTVASGQKLIFGCFATHAFVSFGPEPIQVYAAPTVVVPAAPLVDIGAGARLSAR